MSSITLKSVSKNFVAHFRNKGVSFFKSPHRWLRQWDFDSFSALSDIDLNISSGEIVGIVGDNGSGKTSLLKIIAGIIDPSLGQVNTNGRVVALINKGVIFPRLIDFKQGFLSLGLIHGLLTSEVMSSYDEALKFSGMGNVEKLKSSQYSSGMAYRLVFTSAVYSKPEILLIDEAFTFSDGAFKNKAIEKVKDIARVGGVVVMNSHDLPLVRKCCSRVILLHRGKIVKDGPPAETLDYYTKNFRNLN